MSAGFISLEQRFFRRLNTVVEPVVRRGIGSPGLAPAALIVLESIGFKSGLQRRTPLLSTPIGPYRVVATVRGERSFWIKNLITRPHTRYFLAGEARSARAIVLADGETQTPPWSQEASCLLRGLVRTLERRSRGAFTFVILAPETDA